MFWEKLFKELYILIIAKVCFCEFNQVSYGPLIIESSLIVWKSVLFRDGMFELLKEGGALEYWSRGEWNSASCIANSLEIIFRTYSMALSCGNCLGFNDSFLYSNNFKRLSFYWHRLDLQHCVPVNLIPVCKCIGIVGAGSGCQYI